MIGKLSAWLGHWLFRLMPPRLYLRLHGIKLYSEPRAIATVTYRLHGIEKQVQVKFGSAMAIVKTFPLWLRYGFCEPTFLGNERYFIPPHDIQRVGWYDPILEDYFAVC